MLKRIILSGISFCIAISLTVLSVLAKQQAVPEKTVVSSRPPVSSLSVESSSSEIESSSEEVSSSEPESSEPVSSAPPAPAPVQKITGKVTKDPQFKPTEENKKEDPQNNEHPDAGPGGSITIPDTPTTPPASSAPSQPEQGGDTTPPQPGPTFPTDPNYTGWWETDGKTYCYQNGQKMTGWKNINNIGYWFNGNGELSSKMGIDVSVHQGKIDWQAVKSDGIEFALIRVGYRGSVSGKIVIDTRFEENVRAAAAAGIECGVYFFSQAINADEGRAEAEFALNAISGLPVTGPVIIDTEYVAWNPGAGDTEPRGNRTSTSARTDAVAAFCQTVASAGKQTMIYASQSWYENNLQLSRLTSYQKWLARWSESVTWNHDFTIWQCTDKGRVKGINGNVDRNAWKIG